MAKHLGSHQNRVTTTTQTAFGGRKRTGIQPIGIQPIKTPTPFARRPGARLIRRVGGGPPIVQKPTGRPRRRGEVGITGGLAGTRLPNARTSNLRGQLGALKRV